MATLLLIGAAHQLLTTSRTGSKIAETRWGLNLHYYSEIMEFISRKESQAFEDAVLDEHAGDQAEPPSLSHPTGIYPAGVAVSVLLPKDSIGYFSLDGSIPTRRHDRVSGPVHISDSTVLRVKASIESVMSETVTATYIVSSVPGIVFADLVMDPVYLFNKHAGIYSNPRQKGRAWERPGILSIIDPSRDDALELEVRVRIHGAASRGSSNNGRKNFRIMIDGNGDDFQHWIDTGSSGISHKQSEWILRHAGNERQLWSDRFVQRIARQLGLPTSIARPVVLHVNGTPWGVYDIMERVNHEFLMGKAASGDFTLLHGSPLRFPLSAGPEHADWNRLYRLVSESDLSDPEVYSYVESQIDIDTLIDYFALSIFMADSDRPHGNIDLYREIQGPGGQNSKWKFAVWDFDGGLNYRGIFTEHDTLAWHLRSTLRPDLKPVGGADDESMMSTTTLLRGLMQNEEFRHTFNRRFEFLLATTFSSDNLHAALDEMLLDYAAVLPLERSRFERPDQWLLDDVVYLKGSEAEFSYDDRMQEISTFISERPAVVAGLLKEHVARAAQ